MDFTNEQWQAMANRRTSHQQRLVHLNGGFGYGCHTWQQVVNKLETAAYGLDDGTTQHHAESINGLATAREHVAAVRRTWVRTFIALGAGRHWTRQAAAGIDLGDLLLRYRACTGDKEAQAWCEEYGLDYREPRFPRQWSVKEVL